MPARARQVQTGASQCEIGCHEGGGNAVAVSADNFNRAETDVYFACTDIAINRERQRSRKVPAALGEATFRMKSSPLASSIAGT